MLSLGIKYSVRGVICDVNYCAWGANLRYASYNEHDVVSPLYAVNSTPI